MTERELNMLKEALTYAARGFSVFPLHTPQAGRCSCRKRDCKKPGKHPRTDNGFKAATRDPAEIEAFWTRWPDANIGIRTGLASDVIAIDLDGVSAEETWRERVNGHGAAIHTLTSITGRGRHLLFKHSEESIGNSAGKLGDGIDVRGEGGYIVAPPSLHSSGIQYTWEDFAVEIAEMPEWLITLLAEPVQQGKPSHAALSLVGEQPVIPEGRRNNALTSIGGGLRNHGLERPEIERELQRINQAQCSPPLPAQEVTALAKSVSRYVPKVRLTGGKPNPLYYFPFDPSKWHSNPHVRLMSALQIGYYWSLLVESWPLRGFLPDDPDLLWRLARASSREEFERDDNHRLALVEFEPVVVNDHYLLRHALMADTYEELLGKYKTRCENGKKGVEANKRKSQANAKEAAEYYDRGPQE